MQRRIRAECQLANPWHFPAMFCLVLRSLAFNRCSLFLYSSGFALYTSTFDVGSWARTMMSRARLTAVFAVSIGSALFGSALLYPLLVKIRRRSQTSRPDGILVVSDPPDAKFE